MQLNEHKPNQTNQTVYCSSSKYADFNKLDYRLKDGLALTVSLLACWIQSKLIKADKQKQNFR